MFGCVWITDQSHVTRLGPQNLLSEDLKITFFVRCQTLSMLLTWQGGDRGVRGACFNHYVYRCHFYFVIFDLTVATRALWDTPL